jgi:predicted TIM-barrel fold metal-dependent hydrolase
MLDAVSPFYEHVIQSFGTDRCMFESNFSRGKRMGLTSKEKEAIFAGTAERVYRLGFDRGAGERENSAAL